MLEGKAWLNARWRQRGRKTGRRQGKETDPRPGEREYGKRQDEPEQERDGQTADGEGSRNNKEWGEDAAGAKQT